MGHYVLGPDRKPVTARISTTRQVTRLLEIERTELGGGGGAPRRPPQLPSC